MTSFGRCALILAFAGLVAACSTASPGRRGGLSPTQVTELPEDIRVAYELFSIRCSRCHTLARPLNSGITDPRHWRIYVARMKQMPGSGISRRDADRILQFLDYHSAQVRAGRTSGGPVRDVFEAITSTRASEARAAPPVAREFEEDPSSP
ncbi:MAG: hypothetical protein ACFB9M_21155 [Myxococcota bacterium]